MNKLERTYRKFIKHILSLQVTMADPAVYILSGAKPIEGVIHKRALVMFGSLCKRGVDSSEKRLARRQLAVKSFESSSWFVAVRKLFIKYDLPDCWDVVDEPQSKTKWMSEVYKQVNDYWVDFCEIQSSDVYSCGNVRYNTYLYCLVVQAGFYGDVV